MSRRIGNIVIIYDEPDNRCELCGKVSECRPYGPGGKQICFECGEKDPVKTQKMMDHVLFGDPHPEELD